MFPTLLLAPALAASAPNLLLIVADDVGTDKVSAYAADVPGYGPEARFLPQTGVVDDLARAGLRFTAAWANPTCSPTRAALLTGRAGFRTGVGMPVPIGPDLDPATPAPLPALLAQPGVGDRDGYATALFGKWHLGSAGARGTTDWESTGAPRTVADSANPLRFGFQHFDGSLGGQLVDYHAWTRIVSDPGRSTVSTERGYATDVTTAAAAAWIRQQSGPWFAMLSYNAAHVTDRRREYLPQDLEPGCVPMRPEEDGADASPRVYQSLVECMDTRIGELLVGLPEATVANTVIVFVGDNGTERFVLEGPFAATNGHPSIGKTTAYETGVHVPLTITDGAAWLALRACDPAARAAGTCPKPAGRITAPGRVVTAATDVTDLYATLATLAGADPSRGTDAVSLVPCFGDPRPGCDAGGPPQDRQAWAEIFQYGAGDVPIRAEGAFRVGDDKLVVRYARGAGCVTRELYDLAADPMEQRDLAASDPTTLARLAQKLDALGVSWLRGVRPCAAGEADTHSGPPGGKRPGGGRPGGRGLPPKPH